MWGAEGLRWKSSRLLTGWKYIIDLDLSLFFFSHNLKIMISFSQGTINTINTPPHQHHLHGYYHHQHQYHPQSHIVGTTITSISITIKSTSWVLPSPASAPPPAPHRGYCHYQHYHHQPWDGERREAGYNPSPATQMTLVTSGHLSWFQPLSMRWG